MAADPIQDRTEPDGANRPTFGGFSNRYNSFIRFFIFDCKTSKLFNRKPVEKYCRRS